MRDQALTPLWHPKRICDGCNVTEHAFKVARLNGDNGWLELASQRSAKVVMCHCTDSALVLHNDHRWLQCAQLLLKDVIDGLILLRLLAHLLVERTVGMDDRPAWASARRD